jgi:uncharacterized membrane protein YkgB/quercetin dioxygenase-like cupin family protein
MSIAKERVRSPAAMSAAAMDQRNAVQVVAAYLLRYGLGLVIAWIGFMKFTPYEAAGIQPLVAHSPLISWVYAIFSERAFSALLGVAEVAIAAMIWLRSLSAKVSAIGSGLAAVMFLTTLTFLFSTPGWEPSLGGFPALSAMPGQFLLKDLVLLAAALWSLGEVLPEALPLQGGAMETMTKGWTFGRLRRRSGAGRRECSELATRAPRTEVRPVARRAAKALAGLAVAAALAVAVGLALAADPPNRPASTGEGEIVKTLFSKKLPNVPGKTLTVVLVNYRPGGFSTPHRHPASGFVFAYVLSGTIRSQVEGEPLGVYRVGQSWTEPPNAHHIVSANASKTQPAQLIAYIIADDGDEPTLYDK